MKPVPTGEVPLQLSLRKGSSGLPKGPQPQLPDWGRTTSQKTPRPGPWPEPPADLAQIPLLSQRKGSSLCGKFMLKDIQQPQAQVCHFQFRQFKATLGVGGRSPGPPLSGWRRHLQSELLAPNSPLGGFPLSFESQLFLGF